MPAWSTLDLVAQGVVDGPISVEETLIISLFWKNWECFHCAMKDHHKCSVGKKIFLQNPVQLLCQCPH